MVPRIEVHRKHMNLGAQGWWAIGAEVFLRQVTQRRESSVSDTSRANENMERKKVQDSRSWV